MATAVVSEVPDPGKQDVSDASTSQTMGKVMSSASGQEVPEASPSPVEETQVQSTTKTHEKATSSAGDSHVRRGQSSRGRGRGQLQFRSRETTPTGPDTQERKKSVKYEDEAALNETGDVNCNVQQAAECRGRAAARARGRARGRGRGRSKPPSRGPTATAGPVDVAGLDSQGASNATPKDYESHQFDDASEGSEWYSATSEIEGRSPSEDVTNLQRSVRGMQPSRVGKHLTEKETNNNPLLSTLAESVTLAGKNIKQGTFQHILSFLTWQELLDIQQVSPAWKDATDACLAQRTELHIGEFDFPAVLEDETLEVALRAMPGLQRLSIDWRPDGRKLDIDVVTQNCRHLTEIDLTRFRLDEWSLKQLCVACPGLKAVKMPHKSDDVLVDVLLRNLPGLRSLDLSKTNVTGQFLKQIHSAVEKISLAGCISLKLGDVCVLTREGVRQLHCWKKVRDLDVSSTKIRDPELKGVLRLFPNLQRLSLAHCSQLQSVIIHVALCGILRDLDIYHIGVLRVPELLAVLTIPQLERLSLAGCTFEGSSLLPFPSLTPLPLRELDITETRGLTAFHMSAILTRTTKLEKLYAANLGDLDMVACLTHLSRCWQLRELDLSRSGSRQPGGQKTAAVEPAKHPGSEKTSQLQAGKLFQPTKSGVIRPAVFTFGSGNNEPQTQNNKPQEIKQEKGQEQHEEPEATAKVTPQAAAPSQDSRHRPTQVWSGFGTKNFKPQGMKQEQEQEQNGKPEPMTKVAQQNAPPSGDSRHCPTQFWSGFGTQNFKPQENKRRQQEEGKKGKGEEAAEDPTTKVAPQFAAPTEDSRPGMFVFGGLKPDPILQNPNELTDYLTRQIHPVFLQALVSGCPKLERLLLAGCHLTEPGSLRHLVHCVNLRELDLSRATNVEATELAVGLEGCARIERLSVAQLNVPLEQLVPPSGLLMLTHLNVSQSGMTNNSLRRLPRLFPRLRSLNLQGCASVGEDGLMSYLPRLQQLRSLDLRGVRGVTEAVLERLKKTKLTKLRLGDSGGDVRLSQNGVRKLALGCHSLEVLWLDVPEDFLKKVTGLLERQMPGHRILVICSGRNAARQSAGVKSHKIHVVDEDAVSWESD